MARDDYGIDAVIDVVQRERLIPVSDLFVLRGKLLEASPWGTDFWACRARQALTRAELYPQRWGFHLADPRREHARRVAAYYQIIAWGDPDRIVQVAVPDVVSALGVPDSCVRRAHRTLIAEGLLEVLDRQGGRNPAKFRWTGAAPEDPRKLGFDPEDPALFRSGPPRDRGSERGCDRPPIYKEERGIEPSAASELTPQKPPPRIAPEPPSTVLSIPTQTGSFDVSAYQLARWEGAFPHVDVLALLEHLREKAGAMKAEGKPVVRPTHWIRRCLKRDFMFPARQSAFEFPELPEPDAEPDSPPLHVEVHLAEERLDAEIASSDPLRGQVLKRDRDAIAVRTDLDLETRLRLLRHVAGPQPDEGPNLELEGLLKDARSRFDEVKQAEEQLAEHRRRLRSVLGAGAAPRFEALARSFAQIDRVEREEGVEAAAAAAAVLIPTYEETP